MTSVLTALGPRWDGVVVAALESSGQVRIASRCADLTDLLATAAAGLGTVALVSAQLRGLGLSEVSDLRGHGVEVVGVSDPGDESSELRLWQLGVAVVVRADAPQDELVRAVLTSAPTPGPPLGAAPHFTEVPAGDDHRPHPAPAPAGPARGRVLAVWGPAGAPGRTTLAVSVAAELSALGRRVLLVDADTYCGSVAQHLAILDEAPGIVAATRAADQGALDVLALARLTPEVLAGLRVLTGIPKAERWLEIRGPALERVLEVARALVDDVVVDVGFCLEDDEELSYDTLAPRRNQATLTTLEVADELLAVGGCDPVSLQRLVRGLQELGTVRAPRPLVVVNRLRPGPVGSPAERQVGDALDRFAGVPEVVFVPDDQVALDAAMLAGRTLLEIAPASPARRAVAGLAARLAGVPTGDGSAARRRRRR